MYRFEAKSQSQEEAMVDQSKALLLDGPWWSGKTHVGLAKALMIGLQYPNDRIALVRQKCCDLKATLWHRLNHKHLSYLPVLAVSDKGGMYRMFANGTEILGCGLDSASDRKKLSAKRFRFILVDEANLITEADFEWLLDCLHLPIIGQFAQIMLISDPGDPNSFLYRRFIKQPFDGYKRIRCSMLSDIPDSCYSLLNGLSGICRENFLEGNWIAR